MPAQKTDLSFKQEVNGLRALAVLLVLFFHLELPYFEAGFLGVDVFLVISGYLITRNILQELTTSKFNLLNFYAKRFKRLAPAFIFTITISLIFGYITLTPVAFENLGYAAKACVLFYSNIHYLHQTGYFDTESAFKPLLHIWSLSLEEQFYFVWPISLWILFKIFKQRVYIPLLLLLLGSLYLAQTTVVAAPERAFYLLQYRAFQFLLGAACIWIEKASVFKNRYREFFTLLGIGLIVYSSYAFNGKSEMPGLQSLIPCGAAMLVICAGNSKYSGWLLRNKVADLIGKSSYSIYLAHWPLIVYYKYYTLSELSKTSAFSIAVLSIAVGLLMWRSIENPIRRINTKLFKVDLVWIWLPALLLSLFYFARNISLNKGYPSRYSAEFLMSDEEIVQQRERYWLGANSEKEVLKGSNSKKIAVFGNSFSIDLIYALRKNGLKANIVSIQTTHRCYNFTESALAKEDEQFCRAMNTDVFNDTTWLKADAVYLFDHWPKFEPNDLRLILNKIRTKTKVPIYVFGPKMIFKRPVPEIVHGCKSASAFAINKFAQTYAEKVDRIALNNMLIDFFNDEIYKKQDIKFINVLAVLGGDDYMFDVVSRKNSKFLYFDPSHFTDQGAQEFGELLKKKHSYLFDNF